MKKPKIIFYLVSLIILAISFNIFAQNNSQEKYSKVRIHATSNLDFKSITRAGLNFDGGIFKPGQYFETWLSESEIKMLKASGVPYEITVPDWMQYYNSLPQMSPQQIQEQMKQSIDVYNVSHSIYGTVGGNLSWVQVKMKLDSMRLLWPTLISQRFSIGNTYENDSMWTVRVTKNPDAPTGRPEVWYNGVTHAREPGGMMNVFYFLYWLFENYNIDPIATYILNNREIYFTPVVNVDGYKYNIQTNPTGGGMWRKNRHPYSSIGVDLNRNYGTYNFWNSSNGGSSTLPSDDTYRGPAPFSEPETQVTKAFVNSRNIRASLSYHTYGNYLIKPYSWCDPTPTPDDATFNEYGNDIVAVNNFLYGTPYQTVGYYVRGGCQDFFYSTDSTGLSMHDFDMTPEVGTFGFWSSPDLIIPEAQSCFYMNQYYALIAGSYPGLKNLVFNKTNYTQNETGNIKVVFRNKGLMNAQNIKVEFTALNGYISIPVQLYNKASMPSRTSDSVTFNFTISGSCPNGYAIPARISIKQNDSLIVYSQNYNILVGNGVTTFADSAENGTSNWTYGTGWAINTTNYHSPTHSFAYPNYAANVNSSLSLNFPLNLSSYPVAFLEFWHRYDVETGYDYCYVEVSSDNGSTWQNVATYNGTMTTWTKQSFDISSMVNSSSNVRVRFRLTSDVGVQNTGWYVDDIKITNYQGQTSLPLTLKTYLSGFYNGSTMVPKNVTVELHNATTPFALVESKIVLLDASGVGNPQYTTAVNGTPYYIVLKFDNGLETWSATPQTFTGSTLNYDFTTSSTQAYGSNMVLVGTKWCVISGDVNQDGSVDALDRSACWNDRNLVGVYTSDLNGDGVVDALDRSICWNNRNLTVQKPALAASPGVKRDGKLNKNDTKDKYDLKLDGSNAKKVIRSNN